MAHATWSDNFMSDIQWIVTKWANMHKGSSKPSLKSGLVECMNRSDKIWYCADFHLRKCQFTDTHQGIFREQTSTLHHIYVKCWLKRRVKAAHAEAVCNAD